MVKCWCYALESEIHRENTILVKSDTVLEARVCPQVSCGFNVKMSPRGLVVGPGVVRFICVGSNVVTRISGSRIRVDLRV